MPSGHGEQAPSAEERVAANWAIDASIADTAAPVQMGPAQGTYVIIDEHGRVVERRAEDD